NTYHLPPRFRIFTPISSLPSLQREPHPRYRSRQLFPAYDPPASDRTMFVEPESSSRRAPQEADSQDDESTRATCARKRKRIAAVPSGPSILAASWRFGLVPKSSVFSTPFNGRKGALYVVEFVAPLHPADKGFLARLASERLSPTSITQPSPNR